MNLRDIINSINDKKILKMLKKMNSNDVLCFLMSLNILMSTSGLAFASSDYKDNGSDTNGGDVDNTAMEASLMPSVMAPLFNYDALSILEKQVYIEEFYDVNYMDLVKAATVKEYGINYKK